MEAGPDITASRTYGELREQAVRFGLGSLADVDTLALFLARGGASSAARQHGAALLQRWGSLDRVLAADLADLTGLIGEAAALDLKLLLTAAERLTAGAVRQRDVISSWGALQSYLRVRLGGLGCEEFRVLFLDKRNRLLADEVLGRGTIDHAPVYPREVVRRALQLGACALILSHNHPSGDTSPSAADINVTREIIQACGLFKVVVHDHVIVAEQSVVSFKQLGLI